MAKRSDEKLFNILEVAQCPRSIQPELRQLVQEGASLRAAVDRLKEIKDRIAQIVIEEYGLANDDGVYGVRDGPHCVLVRQQQGRETLSKELLIENGVTPEQISASLKRGNGFNLVEFSEMTGD